MALEDRACFVAEAFASRQWIWERQPLHATLESLGWKKRHTVGHRDAYHLADGLEVDIYHNGDRPTLMEVTIEAFTEVDSLNDLEYEDKVDEFYDGFLQATQRISESLGKPVFSNGQAAVGFPEDQDAVWLSLWNLTSARLMLQQKHEDRELPFRICVVVAPPDCVNQ